MGTGPKAAGPPSEGLPRERRITSGADLRNLMRRGKKSRTAHLDVFDSASPEPFSRVGVIVPRHRHRVVERNLLKRRLREILRREILVRLAAAGVAADVLVRARREAYDASFAELRDELLAWLGRRWPLDS